MPEPDELFGQVGNDPLSAAIETGRNALSEGSDLCDFHVDLYSPQITNACIAAKFRSARVGSASSKPFDRGDQENTPVAQRVGFEWRHRSNPDHDAGKDRTVTPT